MASLRKRRILNMNPQGETLAERYRRKVAGDDRGTSLGRDSVSALSDHLGPEEAGTD